MREHLNKQLLLINKQFSIQKSQLKVFQMILSEFSENDLNKHDIKSIKRVIDNALDQRNSDSEEQLLLVKHKIAQHFTDKMLTLKTYILQQSNQNIVDFLTCLQHILNDIIKSNNVKEIITIQDSLYFDQLCLVQRHEETTIKNLNVSVYDAKSVTDTKITLDRLISMLPEQFKILNQPNANEILKNYAITNIENFCQNIATTFEILSHLIKETSQKIIPCRIKLSHSMFCGSFEYLQKVFSYISEDLPLTKDVKSKVITFLNSIPFGDHMINIFSQDINHLRQLNKNIMTKHQKESSRLEKIQYINTTIESFLRTKNHHELLKLLSFKVDVSSDEINTLENNIIITHHYHMIKAVDNLINNINMIHSDQHTNNFFEHIDDLLTDWLQFLFDEGVHLKHLQQAIDQPYAFLNLSQDMLGRLNCLADEIISAKVIQPQKSHQHVKPITSTDLMAKDPDITSRRVNNPNLDGQLSFMR
ncbi:MAG: hypothetical protein ACON5A_01170 [Candidatus Comchoanobacterales bacterium]